MTYADEVAGCFGLALFGTVICGIASEVSVTDEIDSEHAKSHFIEIIAEDSRSTGASSLWQTDSTGTGAWQDGTSLSVTETVSA